MMSLVEVAKILSARLYPVLVWGALMGFAVHAGLRSQFMHEVGASEQISLNDNISASAPTHVYVDTPRAYGDEDASDRPSLM